MFLEVIFWIAFIAVCQMIAKLYYRRRDVLYGPYCATTRRPGYRPTTEIAKVSINRIPRVRGGSMCEPPSDQALRSSESEGARPPKTIFAASPTAATPEQCGHDETVVPQAPHQGSSERRGMPNFKSMAFGEI
jgi:hypothetical protein